MREFTEVSQDTRDLGERSFDSDVRFDLNHDIEVKEQTEEQADDQSFLSLQVIEVPEQTEGEDLLGENRRNADDNVDIPEEGHDIPETGIVTAYHNANYRPESTESSLSQEGSDLNRPLDLSEVQSWLGDINPNFDEFDPESPYCNNCGSCALAVYQRMEGDTESCADANNIGYDDEMEAITGLEIISMEPGDIEQRLLEEGEGAHAIIGIDRAEGAGHWFNAACINGKVVAIDGQTGEISDWPPDYGDVVNWEMSVKK